MSPVFQGFSRDRRRDQKFPSNFNVIHLGKTALRDSLYTDKVKTFLLWLLVLGLIVGSVFVWWTVGLEYASGLNRLKPEALPAVGEKAEKAVPIASDSVFVPILMYHYIRDYQNEADPLGEGLSVAPETFAKQLDTLISAGFQATSLTKLASGQLPPKPLILTFDDGYLDAYTSAFPLLQERGLTATFFVVKNFIGKPGYMNEGQIVALKAAGMEIGGHSLTHRNLASAPYEKAIDEIAGSLRGHDNVFCYPAGKYSNETLDIVSGLGVRAAVTTNIGVVSAASSLYELPRIRVKEKTDVVQRIKEEIAIVKRELNTSQRSKD